MRFLFISTVGSTMHFFQRLISELQAAGHSVDIAANDSLKAFPDFYSDFGGKIFHLSCSRSPFSVGSVKAIRQIRQIVSENRYDIVHCNTPIAGACARLACRRFRKNGLRVIYTAHGFHFYQGAPKKNWLIYYPIEKFCSRFTDTLITINHEDFAFAKKKLHAKTVEYIPSVGVDVEKFKTATVDKDALRAEFSVPSDAFLLISVGELIENKNHQVVIRALAQTKHKNVHYLLVGKGSLKDALFELSRQLDLENRVHFSGFRTDVPRLYQIADAEVFPSIREGFGLAAVEGMAAGLPLICSDNRGTREYMPAYDGTGFSGVCRSVEDFSAAIDRLAADSALCRKLSRIGEDACEQFSDRIVCEKMKAIYGID